MFERLKISAALASLVVTTAHAATWSASDMTEQGNTMAAAGASPLQQAQSFSPSMLGAQKLTAKPRSTNGFTANQNQLAQPAPEPKPITCAKPQDLNDFQQYLCRSANVALPVFGQRMFTGAESSFSAMESVPVAPDYLLNVGDEFSLRIWGQLDAELELKVDRSGSVFIPRVGNIKVVGVPFGALKSFLSKEVGRVFRNFDLAVTMGQLRTVQVFVVGFARKPGSYTLGSLSTVVNALFAAGGPDNSGSMRQIQIKRGNRVVGQFDLYDLLLKGDKTGDLLLQSGDVIFVPAAGPQVAIYGSVKAPAVYELKSNETLKDLINLAGGAQQSALDGQVSVERLVDNKGRAMESVPLQQADKFQLRGGDVAQIYGIGSKVEQVVALRGNVAQPVRQAWRKGMKISDLISSRAMLQTPDYWEHKTRSDAGSALEKDSAVAKTSRNVRADSSEINWDYAVIERINPADMSTRLVPFNLAKALEKDPAEDRVLESGDIVNVFSKSDIQINSAKRTRFVRLEGEVAVPGFYEVREGETLRDLVKRVGGLSSRAYLFGAELDRESVRKKQKAELEKYADEMRVAANRQAADLAANAVRAESATGAQVQAQQAQQMAEKLKALRATGRIVLGVRPEDKSADDLPALELEDGDRLFVPHTPGTVDVLGSIFSRNNAYMYVNGKRIEDYLEQAGGPTSDAEQDSIHVIRADGSVISAKQKSALAFWRSFDSTAALPGDTIVVPEKVDRTRFTKTLMDWTQILSNFGIGVSAIKNLSN